jgi:hypothetical protein
MGGGVVEEEKTFPYLPSENAFDLYLWIKKLHDQQPVKLKSLNFVLNKPPQKITKPKMLKNLISLQEWKSLQINIKQLEWMKLLEFLAGY